MSGQAEVIQLKSQPQHGIISGKYAPPQPSFLRVERGGKLLFMFDPERGLIEIRVRGDKHTIDLARELWDES